LSQKLRKSETTWLSFRLLKLSLFPNFKQNTMGVDPFLRKKWERMFYTFFDTNKNKVIDWNDFELVFEKIKELRGEQSRDYKIVHETMNMVWRGLLQATKNIDITAEVGPDVEITIDEWCKLWEHYNPNHMHIWQWEYLKFMFLLIDTSGDKFIDKEEYVTIMKMYGLDNKHATAAFEKFAVDENKKKIEKVDYGRFVKLWNEYFMSTDKTKPGSSLFGEV